MREVNRMESCPIDSKGHACMFVVPPKIQSSDSAGRRREGKEGVQRGGGAEGVITSVTRSILKAASWIWSNVALSMISGCSQRLRAVVVSQRWDTCAWYSRGGGLVNRDITREGPECIRR